MRKAARGGLFGEMLLLSTALSNIYFIFFFRGRQWRFVCLADKKPVEREKIKLSYVGFDSSLQDCVLSAEAIANSGLWWDIFYLSTPCLQLKKVLLALGL